MVDGDAFGCTNSILYQIPVHCEQKCDIVSRINQADSLGAFAIKVDLRIMFASGRSCMGKDWIAGHQDRWK